MNKSKKTRFSLNFASLICFLAALALIVLLRVFKDEKFLLWYGRFTDTLMYYELWMQTYGATWISALLIIVNYALKALIPWFPISCICVVSGVLFKWYWAILINIIGLSILYAMKFYWGRYFGAGNAEKIISHYGNAKNFIDSGDVGSNVVLFTLRLSPLIPVNSVSALYGTTDITFWKFWVVSIVGFSYKLFSYTIIGRNVFNPASASFIVPFIILLLFSGFVLLVLSGALTVKGRFKRNKKSER